MSVLEDNPLLTARIIRARCTPDYRAPRRERVSSLSWRTGRRNRDNTMRIDLVRWALPRNEVASLDLGKPPPA